MKVGILTDYPSIAVQSGPSLHTRFLYEGLAERGHQVTLLGPDTGDVMPIEGVKTFLFPGKPFPAHPRVKVMVPGPIGRLAEPPELDVIHGQVANHAIEYAAWIRRRNRTAVLNTHILHLPDHVHFLVGDALYANPMVRAFLEKSAADLEKEIARMYNLGDCLIVQSRHMVNYWRERGVTVPIEVVGRPIDPRKFSRPAGADPFPAHFRPGSRLLVVSRQDREKNLEELISIFDEHIAEGNPDATLTLVGYGHLHAHLVELAADARHGDRIFFAGEVRHDKLVDWYAHADVFVHTSLSETFGNVINEALWTGLPVVALADYRGVSHQVVDGINGFLIEPHRIDTETRFARATLNLLAHQELRRQLGEGAATLSRRVSHPDMVLSRFENIYEEAIRRARTEVREPLAMRSPLTQHATLAKTWATWARWNYAPFALDAVMRRLGLARQVPTELQSAELPPEERRPMPVNAAPIAAE